MRTEFLSIGPSPAQADIVLSSGERPPECATLQNYTWLTFRTGAAHLQTYLTPDKCYELADALREHAAEVRAMMGVAA